MASPRSAPMTSRCCSCTPRISAARWWSWSRSSDMTWVEGIVAYVVIWWIVIFAVLPFGVRPAPKGDPGYAAGAPANPRLALKAAGPTALPALIGLGLYAAVPNHLVDFRAP